MHVSKTIRKINFLTFLTLKFYVSPYVKKYIHVNVALELLLFIDSWFTETAKPFLIPDFINNIFVCRSSHIIKSFRETVLKSLGVSKEFTLRNFVPSQWISLKRDLENHSPDNRFRSKSQKRVKYVSKMSWRRVNQNSLTWWYILKTSSRCLENVFKMSWKRFECLEDLFKMYEQD